MISMHLGSEGWGYVIRLQFSHIFLEEFSEFISREKLANRSITL
jgi:hypothetical protein